MTREETISSLLERYHDLVDPLNGPAGVRGTGEGMPLAAHEPHCELIRKPSAGFVPIAKRPGVARCTCVIEDVLRLERVLRLMRDDRHAKLLRLPSGEKVSVRKCWWHVNAWYVEARPALVTPKLSVPRNKRAKKLQKLLVDDYGKPLPVRVVRRHPGAREDVARLGVRVLAAWWPLESDLKVAA